MQVWARNAINYWRYTADVQQSHSLRKLALFFLSAFLDFLAFGADDEDEADGAAAAAPWQSALASPPLPAYRSVIIRARCAKSSYASRSSLPASSLSADSGLGSISKHLITVRICRMPRFGFQSFLSVLTQISPPLEMFGW